MHLLARPVRLAVIVAMAASTGSAVGSAQGDFTRAAATAIAHGKRAEAERLANARGASDPAAAAVLAELAAHRGKYKDALALLEPVASREGTGDAALALALLYQSLGRATDAAPILNLLLRQANTSSDPAVLVRAARAARALNRPRDANGLFRDAERLGADPAIVETAWGELFLEKHNLVEALKSFDAALVADPGWAPAHAGRARVLEDDDPPKAALAAEKAIAIDPELADAHLLLADLHLDADREADAR